MPTSVVAGFDPDDRRARALDDLARPSARAAADVAELPPQPLPPGPRAVTTACFNGSPVSGAVAEPATARHGSGAAVRRAAGACASRSGSRAVRGGSAAGRIRRPCGTLRVRACGSIPGLHAGVEVLLVQLHADLLPARARAGSRSRAASTRQRAVRVVERRVRHRADRRTRRWRRAAPASGSASPSRARSRAPRPRSPSPSCLRVTELGATGRRPRRRRSGCAIVRASASASRELLGVVALDAALAYISRGGRTRRHQRPR